MSTGRSIHAVPSITPPPREGIEDGPRLRADPLGLSNWQMIQKTAFDLHNKTGSDVLDHGGMRLELGNSARFPPWPPRDASRPSLCGAKFDGGLLRIQPWRALRATLIGPRLAQGQPRRGWLGCPPYPNAVEESVLHRVDAIAARWRSVAPRPLSSASPSLTSAGSDRRHRERFAARVPPSPASVRGVIR